MTRSRSAIRAFVLFGVFAVAMGWWFAISSWRPPGVTVEDSVVASDVVARAGLERHPFRLSFERWHLLEPRLDARHFRIEGEVWENSPLEWMYRYRDLDPVDAGGAPEPDCFVISPSGEIPAGLCPAGSILEGIRRAEDRGRPLPQLVPNGLVGEEFVRSAPLVHGEWAEFATRLGLDPLEVVLVSTDARGPCPMGGIDDCLGAGPHEYRWDRVIHVPSAILIAELETIDGHVSTRFKVTELVFGQEF